MMMLPAAASRFWASDITAMMIVSIVIGMMSGFGGLLLSFHLALPAGPAIILTAGIVYVLSLVLGREGGLLWLMWPGKHLEA
jgi:zinc/manganese transport system permease protein